MAELSYADLEGLWINAGGSANDAPVAAAIALAESSGIPDNVQKGQPYSETGWGLWQITPGDSVPSVGTDTALLDPATNAAAAIVKFKGAGNSFRPWTTFTSGKYLSFLQTNVQPTDQATLASSIGSVPIIGPALDAGSTAASLLGKLLDPTWWKRVAKLALAVVLGLLAASFMFSESKTGEAVKEKGKEAASVAAMA